MPRLVRTFLDAAGRYFGKHAVEPGQFAALGCGEAIWGAVAKPSAFRSPRHGTRRPPSK